MDSTLVYIIATISALAVNMGFYIYFLKRGLPSLVQDVLNDVGPQFSKILTEGPMKRAMSIIGSKSGAVRAEQAIIEKFNENLPKAIPSLGLIAGQLGMEPTEIMSLMNDPMIGPTLQGLLNQFMAKYLGGKGPAQPKQTGELGVIG